MGDDENVHDERAGAAILLPDDPLSSAQGPRWWLSVDLIQALAHAVEGHRGPIELENRGEGRFVLHLLDEDGIPGDAKMISPGEYAHLTELPARLRSGIVVAVALALGALASAGRTEAAPSRPSVYAPHRPLARAASSPALVRHAHYPARRAAATLICPPPGERVRDAAANEPGRTGDFRRTARLTDRRPSVESQAGTRARTGRGSPRSVSTDVGRHRWNGAEMVSRARLGATSRRRHHLSAEASQERRERLEDGVVLRGGHQGIHVSHARIGNESRMTDTRGVH